ncbi:RluA family pseudouridine synthase [Heyndrickxia sporothermodurans]|uniref:RluA family pseudouridine synthase n=1 Tax=Heyndrickxia sporothermodurans TaxID=46224 RepID=UPI002E1C62A6|nr:RluA family pseudouridine synthase [Heyndrickxia sporothermodurans]MED3696942.1 RluA family pseudouridine synthase [Heyndrickxia sporothermodurans]MED3781982.1 RluA family pseudouridine synthase [Heyndrickxia sporothermodurans]
MASYSLQWTIAHKDKDKIIRQFLSEKDISRRALTDIKFAGGQITVNQREENVLYQLKCGDRLEVTFPPEKSSETLVGEDIPLHIIFEDKDLLVIDKPAFMNTIPSREHPKGSLANALIGYYQKQSIDATVHIVTRLDRNTSGLVLVAKHRYIHHLLSQMQQKRMIKRTYEALVEGVLSKDDGTIDAPIGRKESSIIEREVRADGKAARTHYHVLKRRSKFCHIRLSLDTGRTHQIRVHMSYIGHPLLGDDLYGGSTDIYERQALHCSNLTFYHPTLEKEMNFHSDFPFEV